MMYGMEMVTVSNELAQKPKFSVAISSSAYQKLINNTLGDPERSKRFVGSITSAVAVNPELQKCDAGTILAGALLGESLNLSPSPQLGQYYLVPFDCKVRGADGKIIYKTDENGQKITDDKNRWVPVTEKRAQFCLGYKGYIQLALRSGQYKRLIVVTVKEGEFIGWDPFDEILRCNWNESEEREQLETVGYAARFEYLNGFSKTIYWSKEKMLAHADKYSPAFSAEDMKRVENGQIPDKDMRKYSSFWYKNFDEMAMKTMLRQLIGKWGVMSTEFCTAYEHDNKAVTMDAGGNFLSGGEAPLGITDKQMIPEAANVAEKVDLNDL